MMAKMKSAKKRNKAEKMLSARSQMLNILFSVAILTFTIIYLFNSIYDKNHPIKAAYFADLNWWWFLPAALCMVASVMFETMNLWVLCRSVGYRRSVRQSMVYASSDIYFSAITPSATGGQPAAAYYMTKSGVPLSLSTAVLVLNVTIYTVGLLAVAGIAFLIRPGFFIGFSGMEKACVLIGMGFHALLIAVCLICMFSRRVVFWLGDVVIGLLAKLHIFKNKEERIASFRASVSNYRAALSIVRKHRWLLPFLLFNGIMQRVILAPITFFVLRAMGMDQIPFFEIISMQLYCTVGASAIPLPGGVGIAETLYINVFDTFMPGQENLCFFSMLLSRSFSSYLSIIFCGTLTMVHHTRMKRAEFNRRRMAPAFDSLSGADDEDDFNAAPEIDAEPTAETSAEIISETNEEAEAEHRQ